MSTDSDALGADIDAAVQALPGDDQGVALKVWKAIALPILNRVAGYAASPTPSPQWVKVTKSKTDLAAASTNTDIELYSLPTGGVIHSVKIKHSQAFGGGGLGTYVVTVGVAGDLSRYCGSFDVFQAPGNTVMKTERAIGSENQAAATSIRLAATSSGANLNAATTGSVTVWLLVSVAT